MIVDVTAVWETGKRRAPGVPRDTRRPLRLVAGADVTMRITLLEPDGSPVALNFGAADTLLVTGRFGVGGAKMFGVYAAADVAQRGRYSAKLAGSVTRRAGGRRGSWDVWLGKSGGLSFDPVVRLSELYVEPRAYDGSITVAQQIPSSGGQSRRFVALIGPGLGPFVVVIPPGAGGPFGDTNYKVTSYVFTDPTKGDSPLKFPDTGKTTGTFQVFANGILDAGTPVVMTLDSFD